MFSFKVFYLALLATTALATTPQVNVGNTTITGTVFESSNVEFFGGIPFAKPPIGDLRFKPAVFLPTPQVPTLNATTYGFVCFQSIGYPQIQSEDCLTLNVHRPAGLSPDAKLPVMVWIYGGGYVIGGAPGYNGTDLVSYSVARETPIIFVTLNYRLGPLGFPQGIEADQRKALNLGFSDQLAALRWVHENIADFGGDNSKVTVSGESAGAGSIAIFLYGTEIAKFARAIILESGSTVPTFKPERNEAAWQQFVAAVPSCTSVANTANTFDCLMKASSESLLNATFATVTSSTTSYWPAIDGPGGFLPDRPSQLAYETYLPGLIGSNLDEGTIFPQNITSEDTIRNFLKTITAPALDPEKSAAGFEEILRLYPDIPSLGSPFGTGNNTFGLSSQFKRYAAIYGDFIFHSARRSLIQKMNEASVKVYGYLFADGNGPPPFTFPGTVIAPGSLGVAHGAELPFIFNTLNQTETPSSALTLARIMQDYWISFVTNLDPNDDHGFKRPYWAQYTPTIPNLIELDGLQSKSILDNFREQQITFLQDNPDVLHR